MRFLLIDRIIEWQPGVTAKAIKNIALSEDFFDDHFPRRPIMPGVLILEGMAQLGGLFLEETLKADLGLEKKALMTVIDKTKFRDMAVPGDQLLYQVTLKGLNDLGGKVAADGYKEEKRIVSTHFSYAFSDYQDDLLVRDRARLLALWKEGLEHNPGRE